MPLVTLDNVSVSYGHVPLLDDASLQIGEGERVCLIGRNGAGKSTLLRVLAGETEPDSGEVQWGDGVSVAYLHQDREVGGSPSVFDTVAEGLGTAAELVRAYHAAAVEVARGGDLSRLEQLQHELEAADGWRLEKRVEAVLTRFRLDPDAAMNTLSGGIRRRALLARAVVGEPDLLLLDEPTNHLDIAAIAWLEEFLAGFAGSLLFVTHDRAFLERLATRIVELDRGRLTSYPGDYRTYLERKAAALAAEEEQAAKFDKKLSQEEAWIRQGIKARRTRNEGRVRALQAMRAERARRRERQGQAKLQLERGQASGKLVVEAEDVAAGYDGMPLFEGFHTRIVRGDRVGIIGPNGVGKSTLLKLLLGELEPLRGRIRHGTRLQVAYFDQRRERLDPDAAVIDSLNQGRDTVTVNGRTRHVISYLQDFLFPPERVRSPVQSLSGGERNRLLLARLFARPANLLVMDEPTNDLDVETLELLEELLLNYDGTLLLVSHDRAFLDHVVTSSLVFEHGRVNEYVGGYSDWLHQARGRDTTGQVGRERPVPAEHPTRRPGPKADRPRKLGYKEQRELEALPARIEQLEQQLSELQERMSAPDFYRGDSGDIAAASERLRRLEDDLEEAFERWASLEALRP